MRAVGAIDKAIAGAIPARKADLLKDLDTLAPYVASHGGVEDHDWLGTLRREIWMERRA